MLLTEDWVHEYKLLDRDYLGILRISTWDKFVVVHCGSVRLATFHFVDGMNKCISTDV